MKWASVDGKWVGWAWSPLVFCSESDHHFQAIKIARGVEAASVLGWAPPVADPGLSGS